MRDEAKSIRAQIAASPLVVQARKSASLAGMNRSADLVDNSSQRQPLTLVFIICVVFVVLAIGAPGLFGL